MSKVALLVGINYRGTSSELNGCINDVNSAKEFILTQGYEEKDIIVLTDDTILKPTRRNIMRKLMKLILSDAKNIYFHYSGHGTHIRDRNGDEKDGQDECLYPIDGKLIVDDELNGMLQSLKEDQSLFAVLDCCHSGTGMDLCYNLFEQVSTKKLMMVKDGKSPKETKGQVVMISGCQDQQTSADAYISNKYQGALTAMYLKNMKSGIKTYEELISLIRKDLEQGRYEQIPVLTSGKPLKLNDDIKL